MREVTLPAEDGFKKLIALADAMFVENAKIAQKESDDKYMAEFGHTGPKMASPLDSAGRTYVYWRVRLSDQLDLPKAREALKYT